MFGRVWRFIKRHRNKFIFSASIAAGDMLFTVLNFLLSLCQSDIRISLIEIKRFKIFSEVVGIWGKCI